MHLFKCGGTSVAQAIQTCYLDLNIINRPIFRLNVRAASNALNKFKCSSNSAITQLDAKHLNQKLREYLVLYHMSQDRTRYIAGHFSFSETIYQNYSDQYAFITVLRDPVERYISAYLYQRYRNRKLDLEIEDYLESEAGQNAGSFYTRNLSGYENAEKCESKIASQRAKQNLHKFKIVGCLEYQSEFLNQFEEKFGRRLKLRVFNRSPKAVQKHNLTVDKSIRQKIIAICQSDLEIYQYVVDNLVKA